MAAVAVAVASMAVVVAVASTAVVVAVPRRWRRRTPVILRTDSARNGWRNASRFYCANQAASHLSDSGGSLGMGKISRARCHLAQLLAIAEQAGQHLQ